jgi:hypothetical protein
LRIQAAVPEATTSAQDRAMPFVVGLGAEGLDRMAKGFEAAAPSPAPLGRSRVDGSAVKVVSQTPTLRRRGGRAMAAM